jgi:hypothetical protein
VLVQNGTACQGGVDVGFLWQVDIGADSTKTVRDIPTGSCVTKSFLRCPRTRSIADHYRCSYNGETEV